MFDQRPFIELALQEFVKLGGSPTVKHNLLDYSYFYYPKNCVQKKKCKFMSVNNSASGFKLKMTQNFTPYASANDIVLIWPAASGAWDNNRSTGDLYNTKYSIQSLFNQQLIKKLSEPLDPTYDYKVEGAGDFVLTITQGKKFIAGMLDGLLALNNLEQLEACIEGSH